MLKEYRTLLPYLKKYAPRYLIGFSFLLAVDGLQLVIPQIIKRAVDLISSGVFQLSDILRLVSLIALVALAISAGRFVWRRMIFGSARCIESELRQRLFGHLVIQGSRFYQRNKVGDLMARATNDVSQVRQSTGMGFVSFIDGVFMSLSIIIIMFVQSPSIALYTVIPLPIITFLIIAMGGFVAKRFERVQAAYSKLSDIAQESVAGIRIVKAFAREGHFAGEFSKANDGYRDANMVLVKVFGLFFPLVSFLAGITMMILILSGGKAAIANRFSAGDIVSMLAYLEMLIWPMLGAGFTVNMLQRGAASLKRVNEILGSAPEIVDPPGAARGEPGGSVRIRGLSYSYPDSGKRVLDDISFEIEAGATLGILGRTGSGKSTLLKLLPRLLDMEPGTIFIGGRDAREWEIRSLRSAFGFVPQESFLFSASIRDNIAFADPSLSEERLKRAAEISTISRDIADFPSGWDTVVGERGLSLSGGQKQRVAISRAVAIDPAILVFDDSLSAVDTQTEERILAALLEERKGKTTIIVSHRVSTLKHADRIVVLDSGRLIQSGSHESLLTQENGLYAEIARLQQLDREKGE
jgi:ATP-binding cassette subfamily B multidrug efflux pump